MGICCCKSDPGDGADLDAISGSVGDSGRAAERRTVKGQTSKKSQNERMERAAKTGMLGLADAKLVQVPQQVYSIQKLRNLDLQNNMLTTISPGICNLKMLKSLNLTNNRIEHLPEGMGVLTNLQNLKLGHNSLSTLPTLPKSIKTLSLSENKFETLPESIKSIDMLVELVADKNKIAGAIPGWIGSLPKLVSIDLSSNEINSIDPNVGSSTTLNILLLADNNISQVPQEVLLSQNLARMRLERNNITKTRLETTTGFDAFNQRRLAAIDKQLAGGMTNTDRSICGLDDAEISNL
uniref:Leucine-rich repeat protein n=1 Tax=Mucochytrium quahogii TaxID=96639 RepID=A0A7S2WB26_9STRA|mmetsp:Transcript_3916/g.5696  ORF Transcript_3916/g.5696 Transcript_3916/m.5696 type:complete len:295 (-) Transcript_3916:148-1032(-)